MFSPSNAFTTGLSAFCYLDTKQFFTIFISKLFNASTAIDFLKLVAVLINPSFVKYMSCGFIAPNFISKSLFLFLCLRSKVEVLINLIFNNLLASILFV